MEKLASIALLGALTTTGAVAIADVSDEVLQEANVVAFALQERALMNALELYHLKTGSYPNVSDEAVVKTLHEAGLLQEAQTAYKVEYERTKTGAYRLQVG